MIDIDDLLDRIRSIMNSHGMTNSQFCEKIGVQRSLLSHVLSKRNRPSLDFLLKVHNAFGFVTLDWLLLGKGETNLPKDLFGEKPPILLTESKDSYHDSKQNDHTNNKNIHSIEPKNQAKDSSTTTNGMKINSNDSAYQIVLFYPDGTFKTFINRNK